MPPPDPSSQLTTDLTTAITRSLSQRRPILHHLNADTTWLLQIPRPAAAVRRGGRVYYNILVDPWLRGGQSDVARWFSQQWHREESCVGTVGEVERLIWGVEGVARGEMMGADVDKEEDEMDEGEDGERETCIDAVAVSHEFTDHCHRETLEEVGRDVPVFATEKAAALISSWNHFRHVATIPAFTTEDPDWRSASLPPLPEWLSIARLTEPGDAFYYHSALLIAFNSGPMPSPTTTSTPHASTNGTRKSRKPTYTDIPDTSDAAECLVYTPHGIPPSALSPIAVAAPPLSVLAFLHGLHDVRIGVAKGSQQLNLGAHNGVKAQRVLRAKYWVGTHDEVKRGGGLVSWFLNRRVVGVEEAVRGERERLRREGEDEGEWEDVRFEEVGNGESRVLE
ncbi:hypothetical protein K490DRAFT_62348 [Saccharata proteae CBS 121410]|uniref:Uncharacterized protein n=1 Tax=Saccharata proteae CBS 121410 TaxID=1314787 RepID=A0A9P4LZF3_9PEZI|nr:hypothetical protein K490DRAFT_62348 [Saccharata proteae CBS 121410]